MKLCSIASGSSGNCIFAGSERTSLLIDAGISGKRVEMGLNSLDRTAKSPMNTLITYRDWAFLPEGTRYQSTPQREPFTRFWNAGIWENFRRAFFMKSGKTSLLRWEIWISIRLRSLMMPRSRWVTGWSTAGAPWRWLRIWEFMIPTLWTI